MRITITLAFASLALAQNKPAYLDKETFYQLESITNPAISPDGSQIVFSRGYVDIMKDQNAQNLWIVDVKGERPREMTQGIWRDSAPLWSPDGKRIAFVSTRSGSPQVHAMWADTRESTQLTRAEQTPSNLKWSPDSKRIAFTMFLEDDTPILPIKLPKAPKGAQLAKAATVIDRPSWGADGTGATRKGYTHVFTVDAQTGGIPRQVTSGNYSHTLGSWSSDGKTIFVSAIRKPGAEFLRGDAEIFSIPLDTLQPKALTDRAGPDLTPIASPDGRWIAYTGFDQRDFTNHIANLYIMHVSGDNTRVWASGLPSSPTGVAWSPDSKGVYYSMQEKGEENLYFVSTANPQASPRKMTNGAHLLTQISLADNGQAAAVRSNIREPGVLVTFPIDNSSQTKALMDVNADVLAGRKIADAEELWFTAPDGVKSQGWLMKPANYQPGKKFPLVLWIHGGPWSMYNVGWSWAYQNFAANGYGVLWTNPRGSTGYGQEFVLGIQKSYPGKDYDDLMAGVDAAVAKGWVDKDNLFVCGGSGGGVLTAWIVGHTNRFRASVSMRPVINWHSFVGNTDSVNWYHQFKKMPWEDPLEYAVRSPLHYVANITTPTLVMTGESDLRTPITQSEEFYRALKVLKKETLLIRMPEEFHGWRRPSHQIAQQLYLLAWFEKYRTKESKEAVGGPE